MLASKVEATEEKLNRLFQTKLGTTGSPPRCLSIRKITVKVQTRRPFGSAQPRGVLDVRDTPTASWRSCVETRKELSHAIW